MIIKYVIYKITNIKNNKFYIGSASFYEKRKDKHLWGLRNNHHNNKYLQNSWNKYGEENFVFTIIEQCNKDNLVKREQYWLDFTKCYDRSIGYNIAKFANSPLGCKRTEEFKKNVGDFWRGKKFSKERIEKLKDRVTKLQGKSVIQYDKNMNIIEEFQSISEASRKTGLCIAAISKNCSRKRIGRFKKPRGKFIFKYKDIV